MNVKLKVLFLAAEAEPFARVGGLADVAGALPGALRAMGVDVRLMIPRYGNIHSEEYAFHRVGNSIPVPVGADYERVHLLSTTSDDVPVYLIWNDQYFANREKIYGFNDDPQRFMFFSRAVIATLAALDWTPDVIHANDWHTAMVPVWLDVYGSAEDRYRDIATLFTIHDLTYQGLCGRLLLTFGQMSRLGHLPVEPPGQVNWLAQAIAHADLVSTVSATYAHEMLNGELDQKIADLLQDKQDDLFGILGGINTTLWDPDTDTALAQTYDVDSLSMRAVNKSVLQRELRLQADADVPLVAVASRLNMLQDLEVIQPVITTLVAQQAMQFVLVGIGEPEHEAAYRDLQKAFPNYVRLTKFDERLERRIYGAADMFVLPGRIEPSGVSQMTAMRYGAVPVVRAVDGWVDMVVDADARPKQGTGFAFSAYTVEALIDALQRALAAYEDKVTWTKIQRRAMGRDFSWKASARAYVDLYRRAIALHAAK